MSTHSVTYIPPEVLSVLSLLLTQLLQGDNQIRSEAEKDFNEQWIKNQPERTLLALAEVCRAHPDAGIRSFAAVLIRRHLIFDMPMSAMSEPLPEGVKPTLYATLSVHVLSILQVTLLSSLESEAIPVVRRKILSTVAEIAQEGLKRKRRWDELVRWVGESAYKMDGQYGQDRRVDAFSILADAPGIVGAFDENAVGSLMEKGMKDPSFEVRLAAIRAAISYLSQPKLPRTAPVVFSLVLHSLPLMPHEHLPQALQMLIPFATSRPKLFHPHLNDLLNFLLPWFFSAPATPTPNHPSPIDDDRALQQASALELLVSLSEAASSACKKVPAWAPSLVRVCLEGMAGDELEDWDEWGTSRPEDDDEHSYPLAYEQAIDRLALVIGGRIIVPITFQHLPQYMTSPDWKHRHASLMAVASLGEGGGNVLKNDLPKLAMLVTGMFPDSHPRVRFAACQCLGQLCTDLEGRLQQGYHREILSALLPLLADPVPRVHSHAASALVNFSEGIPKATLAIYIGDIVPRLLALLNDNSLRFVQEQAMTTLAMVADAAEEYFTEYYDNVMPVLVNVMRNATTKEYRVLRAKALECAGLIALAVGKERFAPDAHQFCELLLQIQNEPRDTDDPLSHYIMGAWSKVCQSLGSDFGPYLPYSMPPLLEAAEMKPEITVLDANISDREAYEIVDIGGQEVGIRTSSLEDKCAAFENLVIFAHKLGAQFAPYLPRAFDLAVPALDFIFHEGVREAAAMMIPELLLCAKESGTLTIQHVRGIFDPLVKRMALETDASFISSLYSCFGHSLKILGGISVLDANLKQSFFSATQNQLAELGDRRRTRENRIKAENIKADDAFEMELIEESENGALTSITAALKQIDDAHPLLLVASHVRDLAIPWTSDDE